MKLILIDGGPASGKNTLGKLLVKKLSGLGEKYVLLDLDAYVENYNPKWIWETDKQKEKDQKNARIDFGNDIGKYLKKNYNVIAIGERFLTIENIRSFISKISAKCTIYLYHLDVPFELRKMRLHLRGPHSLIDLEQDQKDRDAVIKWPGYVYKNINSSGEDVENLLRLIQKGSGLIKFDEAHLKYEFGKTR
jgi:shikimate kinase